MNKDAKKTCEAAGESAGHIHPHLDNHWHGHVHRQICPHVPPGAGNSQMEFQGDSDSNAGLILSIRSHSGLSGDMLLCGLAVCALSMAGIEPAGARGREWLDELLTRISPQLAGHVQIRPKIVSGIAGWHAYVDLPHEHEHRNLQDITNIIEASGLAQPAKARACECFKILAHCEAKAHSIDIDSVHFHEVGALDSILDICAVCELYEQLGRPILNCSPLPVADGRICCAHGVLPAPAPASLLLLRNLPVRAFEGDPMAGELLTPTALALLRTLPVAFGPWPACAVIEANLVYGTYTYKDAPNGATFVLGRLPQAARQEE